MTFTTMEEAPASPRNAAIYYWGGDWGGGEEKKEEEDAHSHVEGGDLKKGHRHRWMDENDSHYANLYGSTFQKRTSFQRRYRPAAGENIFV